MDSEQETGSGVQAVELIEVRKTFGEVIAIDLDGYWGVAGRHLPAWAHPEKARTLERVP